MSAVNGDKARFQRQRKATLLRRERSRLTQAGLRLAAGRPPRADGSIQPANGAAGATPSSAMHAATATPAPSPETAPRNN